MTDQAKLLDTLKALGIRSATLDGTRIVSFEFFEGKVVTPPDTSPQTPKDFGKTQTCKCGHSDDEHSSEGCLQGCAVDLCAEPEEKP